MRSDVVTLFPEMVLPVLGQSMLKRAQDKGLLEVQVHNLRDWTTDRHHVADDTPYGGGAGMVLKAEPVFRAVETLRARAASDLRIVIPSPQGRVFTQRTAEELSREPRRVVFLCGHYEGFDERVRLGLNAEEISIGDYVLTGGELPALVMIDAAARLIPGVLGDPDSPVQDSFAEALLDHPHYTRPADVRGLAVPEVLLSGNHEAIRRWRRKEALRSTHLKRPELLQDRLLTEEDRRLLGEILQEEAKRQSVLCAEEE
ncbi:tRNA (guanosine(37)-N1)-methyltransferase TrmD [Candidatus Nitrospira bockiana]